VKPEAPDKAYRSTREAAEALLGFIRACALPPPTMIVGSGTGGLHVYWRLARTIAPAGFDRLAAALTSAGEEHGLKFDSQVTSNKCALLRVPGTWNFKFRDEQGRPLPEGVEPSGKDVTIIYGDWR
jgi:hypothetical protein